MFVEAREVSGLVIQMQKTHKLGETGAKKMQWQRDVPEKSQDRISVGISEEQVRDPNLTQGVKEPAWRNQEFGTLWYRYAQGYTLFSRKEHI